MEASEQFDAALRLFDSQQPDALVQGIDALQKAAAAGSGGALSKLAHFAASGVGGRADWDRAVTLLRQAAHAGWQPARLELEVLCGKTGAAAADAPVDIRALVAPRPTAVVSESPRLRTVDAFLSPGECAWLIGRGRDRLERSVVYDVSREGSMVVDDRSNSGAAFRALDIDVPLVFIHARIAHTLGLPQACFEPTQVLHYAAGQRFAPHFDFLHSAEPGHAADLAKRGQRVATFLVYLNEDYQQGETDFPRLNFRFKGRTGDALAFANVDPSLQPDPRTLHAGLPPANGEKWLMSQWIRSQPVL